MDSETTKIITLYEPDDKEWIAYRIEPLRRLLDPETKRVAIYRSATIELKQNPIVLSGEDVLMGFSLTLGDIW